MNKNLNTLAALKERYEQLWSGWRRAAALAKIELLEATTRESDAILDEMEAVMKRLTDSDNATWEEAVRLAQTTGMPAGDRSGQ